MDNRGISPQGLVDTYCIPKIWNNNRVQISLMMVSRTKCLVLQISMVMNYFSPKVFGHLEGFG